VLVGATNQVMFLAHRALYCPDRGGAGVGSHCSSCLWGCYGVHGPSC
jgi:hypothetical protein